MVSGTFVAIILVLSTLAVHYVQCMPVYSAPMMLESPVLIDESVPQYASDFDNELLQQELSALIRQASASRAEQMDVVPLVVIPSQAFEPLVAPRRLERALRSTRVKKGYHYMPSRG